VIHRHRHLLLGRRGRRGVVACGNHLAFHPVFLLLFTLKHLFVLIYLTQIHVHNVNPRTKNSKAKN
jgi:hypothetical protein